MSLPRSWQRLAWRAALSNVGRLDLPYKLTLALTDRCNAQCLLCRIWRRTPRPELTPGEIARFLRRADHFSWIDLTGGEILLREDLDEVVGVILGSCRNLSVLHFPTNGLVVDRTVAFVSRVLALRPPSLVITISIDGPPAVHDRLRGVEGAFTRAVETFRRLRRLRGATVYLGATVSTENAHLLHETLGALQSAVPDFDPAALHLNLVQFSGHYYGNLEDRDAAEGLERHPVWKDALALTPLLSPKGLLQRSYLRRVPAFLSSGHAGIRCQALSATCFVDPAGEVYPCTVFDEPLGSLHDSGFDLRPLWESGRARATRSAIREGRCPGCWSPCEAYPSILGSLASARKASGAVPGAA